MKKLLMLFCCLLPVVLMAQVITTVAGKGTAGYSGDNSLAIAAEFKGPNTLAFDTYGNMYITDGNNNVIRKVNTVGIVTTVAGNGTSGFSGDNGPATLAQLYAPVSIAVDYLGNLFISTARDHRIRKVNALGIITTIAGDGTFGYNGDNIPATAAKLFYPYAAATDNIGNLYLSDYNNHRVRKITAAGIITTVAGDGTNTNNGDNGPATAAGLAGPCWLFRNAAGEIFVPDNSFNRIRKIDGTGVITTFAGGGTGGDGGPATAALLKRPNSITFDNAGNAYIAEAGASVIRKVNSAGIISTIAGTGTPGFSGDGGPAILAQITANSASCDAAGNVYIPDVYNNRIRRVTYNSIEVNNINNILQHVSIYPSPAHDEVTVAWDGGTVQADNELAIINIAGQAVINECHMGSTVSLHTGKLPTGVYIVTVNGSYAGRFVKE